MILIAGLGNPGKKYEKNRHNVGFVVLDTLAYKKGLEFKHDKKFNAEITEIPADSPDHDPVILAKPHTFMNNSGEALQKIAHFYKIPPENIWIIHDELDLPLGEMKIKKSGGPGTHNGLKSIVALLGKNSPRFKIGIESRGVTASQLQDTASFVLSDFFGQEKDVIAKVIEQAVQSIEIGLHEGLESAMNKIN